MGDRHYVLFERTTLIGRLFRLCRRGVATIWIRAVLVIFLGIQLTVLLPGGKVHADTAPTLSNFQSSTWNDNSTGSEVTGTLTWSAGDLIVVVGITENGLLTLGTPTATGLSFSLVTSVNLGDNSDTLSYLWTATAGSGGSSAVTATAAGGSADRGIAAYAFTGSAGIGTTNPLDNSANKVISLTRSSNNSAVISILGDWLADTDTTVTSSPVGGTVRKADNVATQATMFLVDWPDEGAAGTTSYGLANHGGTVDMSGLAIEVKGQSAPIEQEGFRFRMDDGSETAANWLAAQDTNISRTTDIATRLRMLLNTTGDPPSTQYQLEYKRTDLSTYASVPLTVPAAGTVSYGASGVYAASSGATSRNPALPTGVTANSELWAAVGSKNNATHSSTSTNWTKVTQQNSGASWTVSLWRYTGADATAAAAVNVTWTGSVATFGQSWRMQGRTGTTPLGTPSVNTGSASPHTTTGVTTTSPGSRVMYIDAAAANTATGAPGGSWTENLDNGSATGATHLTVGGEDITNSGTGSGNLSITGAAAAWVQWQVELPAPQPAFIMSASSNIAASGASTTAQLTAPSGKSTSDFVTGRIQDDENPADAVDITTDDYTELEWSIQASSFGATNGQAYTFRVTKAGTVLDTYTVTPQWTIAANTSPSSPSSLAQTKTDDTAISTGGWTNETSVKLTAAVTDSDSGDQLKICAEIDPIATAFSSPVGDGDGCSTGVVATGNTATITITGLSSGTEYHWQIKSKDAAGAYSAWVGYGGNTENPPTNPAARDLGVDTSAPTSGTVFDGTVTDVDNSFNSGSLTSLSANWSGFDFTVSGLQKYEYSIGTTAGATDIKNWTNNSTTASVTATGLTLQTSQFYFFNVRAYDNAGNITTRSSDGQRVAPSLSFSMSSPTITFANLNAANSRRDTKTVDLTTTTNAFGGYITRAYITDLPRATNNATISLFAGGSYASPAAWPNDGSQTGFGFTTNDADIFPQSGSCAGGGTAPCYAPFTLTAPGNAIASRGTAATSGDTTTMTYRVEVAPTQGATKYETIIVYTTTAQY